MAQHNITGLTTRDLMAEFYGATTELGRLAFRPLFEEEAEEKDNWHRYLEEVEAEIAKREAESLSL